MGKPRTISQRWYRWDDDEPAWAYMAIACFGLAMLGLCMHLAISGIIRTVGLCMLIGFDAALLFITYYRKQIWWATLFTYITIGVLAWEVGSYFFGSQF